MVRYSSRVWQDRIETLGVLVVSRRLSKRNLLEGRGSQGTGPTRSLPPPVPVLGTRSQSERADWAVGAGVGGTASFTLFYACTTTRGSSPHAAPVHTREIRSCSLLRSPPKAQRIFLLIPRHRTSWKPHPAQRLPARTCFSLSLFPPCSCASPFLPPKTTPATQPAYRHYRCALPSLITSIPPALNHYSLSQPSYPSNSQFHRRQG